MLFYNNQNLLKGEKIMKWIKWLNLAQTILLVIVGILLANFKTITEAGMIVFEIFVILSLVLSIVMLVMHFKKNKKQKQEEKTNEEK